MKTFGYRSWILFSWKNLSLVTIELRILLRGRAINPNIFQKYENNFFPKMTDPPDLENSCRRQMCWINLKENVQNLIKNYVQTQRQLQLCLLCQSHQVSPVGWNLELLDMIPAEFPHPKDVKCKNQSWRQNQNESFKLWISYQMYKWWPWVFLYFPEKNLHQSSKVSLSKYDPWQSLCCSF